MKSQSSHSHWKPFYSICWSVVLLKDTLIILYQAEGLYDASQGASVTACKVLMNV